MDIDWSKAPDGATHFDTAGYRTKSFMKLENGAWYFWPPMSRTTEWSYWCADSVDADTDPFVPRPATAGWNGEGLPPVGTVCEYQTWVNREWKKTKVLAHHLGFAVHSWSVDGDDMEVDAAPPQDFRPISTPEQIEAEEQKLQREQLAYLIAEYMGFDDPREVDTKLAAYIFDHDYRKQVAP